MPATNTVTIALQTFTESGTGTDKNFIIVKKNADGSVSEVLRQNGQAENWVPQYDWYSAESSAITSPTSIELSPGEYLLEVNSPDNQGEYAVLLNAPESRWWSPFVEAQRVYALKQLLQRPWWHFLVAPVNLVPLLLIIGAVVLWWYRNRSQKQS